MNNTMIPVDDPPPPYEARASPSRPQQAAPTATSGPAGLPHTNDNGKPAHPPSQIPHSPLAGAPPSPTQLRQPQQPPPPPSLQRQGQAPPSIARQFPPAFNLYSQSFSRTLTLGEHANQPLYAVRLHSGLSRSPPIVLHNGPDADRCAVLATVENHSFSSAMTLTLPPARGGGRGAASAVEVVSDVGWHRTYAFRMDVGGDGMTTRPETYEWRHSYGAAVEALGGDFDGWKLVRRERARPPGATGGSPPGRFVTSDGFEVVAAWSDTRLSMSKSLRFAFVGTGDTGLLGERWAVAAVMSALGIWDKERKRKR